LSKLYAHDKYQGQDRVRMAEGTGMHISHIGHSVLRTPITHSNSITYCVFLVPPKICYLFTSLLLIITSLLSSILSSF
jgi:hypothetical protein